MCQENATQEVEDTAHVLGPAVAENLLDQFPLDPTTEEGETVLVFWTQCVACEMTHQSGIWEIQMFLGIPLLYPGI